MKLAIVGTGYVGLVSGVCLARKGHHVTCVDLREEVVTRLNNGVPHIHERGLPDLLRTVIASGNFSATTRLEDALAEAELVIIAVGTPSEKGVIDLQYIRAAAAQIGRWLGEHRERSLSVVVKSTVVPGTTDTVVREVLEESSGRGAGGFGLGMNPEFLREGNAIEDFMNPDRIVLGHEDPETLRKLQELYAPWTCDKLAVNCRTAEMIKYANNCLLATQISAVNELANICAATGGLDVMDVMRGVHLDKRWSPILSTGARVSPGILTYLIPGCGFGGSCFPKDVQALRSFGEHLGLPMTILNGVLSVNAAQPQQILGSLRRQWSELSGKRILILGLAFKPDTDDVRESPARPIMQFLDKAGATLFAHDPVAMENARKEWTELRAEYLKDWESSLGSMDGVVVVTAWYEYRSLKQPDLVAQLGGKVIFDARRMFNASDFPESFYHSIGFAPLASSPVLT